MVRTTHRLMCMMIAFVALSGTATAAASLTGDLRGSVDTEYGSADVAGGADGSADGGMPTAAGFGTLGANAQGHNVGASADSDGNVGVTADDHAASDSADVEGRRASATVDGRTVSTDDVPTDLPAADLPAVPALPGGSASVAAAVTVVVTAIGGAMASLTGRFGALFGF